MAKPSICMVSDHGCVRVFKEAKMLLDAGYEVNLICADVPFGYNKFTTVSVYADEDQMKRSVWNSSADIFHVHNEPDNLVYQTKDAAKTGKPVIFDVHDLQSLRVGGVPDEDERKAFQAADGWLFVCEPGRAVAQHSHGNGKPIEVIYSFVNKEFIPENLPATANFKSAVYEGGIGSPEPSVTCQNGAEFLNYRNYLPMVEQLISQGYLMTIHPAGQVPGYLYENAGAVVTKSLPYPVLLSALRVHGLGLVGACCDIPIMQAAMPNKLFEYMSQGVVPVVFNAGEAGRFVTENECGIELTSYENIEDQVVAAPKIREKILAFRHELTMESQLDKLTTFYEAVLN